MVRMTKRERDRLAALIQKRKEQEKSERGFWRMVDRRKSEILERWGIAAETPKMGAESIEKESAKEESSEKVFGDSAASEPPKIAPKLSAFCAG